jgi:hypothetical protein
MLVATAAVALAASGCGGGESPSETVETFFDAAADGDGGEACAQLTEEGKESGAIGALGATSSGACEDAIADIPEQVREQLANVSVETTEESEGEATVEVSSEEQGAISFSLVEEGDDWKIDGLAIADVEI